MAENEEKGGVLSWDMGLQGFIMRRVTGRREGGGYVFGEKARFDLIMVTILYEYVYPRICISCIKKRKGLGRGVTRI